MCRTFDSGQRKQAGDIMSAMTLRYVAQERRANKAAVGHQFVGCKT